LFRLIFSNEDEDVGRVVFGESRGEPYQTQLAVAHTIYNRVHHTGYPNDLMSVIHATCDQGRYQYETLDDNGHSSVSFFGVAV